MKDNSSSYSLAIFEAPSPESSFVGLGFLLLGRPTAPFFEVLVFRDSSESLALSSLQKEAPRSRTTEGERGGLAEHPMQLRSLQDKDLKPLLRL